MVQKSLFEVSVLILLLLFAAACQPKADMPNPASVYCTENEGRLEIREDESGGQIGYCLFEDGSECEEWSFYRGDCQPGDSLEGEVGVPNPASAFCEEQGGRLELRAEDSGGQVGICLFEDGSECEEWAFYRDECQPGEN